VFSPPCSHRSHSVESHTRVHVLFSAPTCAVRRTRFGLAVDTIPQTGQLSPANIFSVSHLRSPHQTPPEAS
jgi:hypothetical protein